MRITTNSTSRESVEVQANNNNMSKRKPTPYFTNPEKMGAMVQSESSFEKVVQALELSPEEYSASRELRIWVRRNKSFKFVPTEVLQTFGFAPGDEA